MRRAYNYLFIVWYNLLKSIERGYINQTTNSRVFNVVLVISLLELLNIMVLLGRLEKGLVLIIGVILVAVNSFIFYKGSHYKKIIEDYHSPNTKSKLFVALYCIASVILFVLSKDLVQI